MINNILWFDDNVNSEQNENYLNLMEKEFPDFKISTISEDQKFFDKINQLKYQAYFVIMSGRKFQIFVEYLLKNSINSIPISVIFTSDKISLKNKFDVNYKKYLEDKFYNPLGIYDFYNGIIKSIKNFLTQLKNEINGIKLGYTSQPNDYKDCYSFEYLDDEYQLIFPALYDSIMKKNNASNEEIKNANKCILEKYGEEIGIKERIFPLINVNDIPQNILAKFWAQIYSLSTVFYRSLNHSLMKKENKEKENEEYINSYIRVLYSGSKDFPCKDNKRLYRGAIMSEKEFDKLYKFYENRKINKKEFEPLYIIYSRAFLSFSKKEETAKNFINYIEGTKMILFRLNYIFDEDMLSNGDLEDISDNPIEQEVLFFPFSSFIITFIDKKDDIDYIDLEYLGIYKDTITKCIEEINNNPDNPELLNRTMRTSYAKDCIQSQIISSKKENNIIEKVSKSQQMITRNIFKYNNYFNYNEIDAIYMKNEKKINLLHNYELTEDLINEVKTSYQEAKKDINSENVEIFVNEKKIKFDFYYESDEIGEIKVKFKFKKLLGNTSYLFYGCSSLKSIDLSLFKTNDIKSMISMFEYCSSLESLNLFSLNTSNVENMSFMFRECSSLKKINLSLFETEKVKDISYMFMDCSSLNSIDLSSFKTINVKNMSHLFESCSSLQSINIASFKTNESTNIRNMFEGCSSLTKENVKMDAEDENILKELSYLK